jgi:hypothetical protein
MILAGVTSLLIFLPVLWWNAGHEWVSFAHQINHGFRNEHHTVVNFQNLSDYTLFLVVLVSPILGLLCFRTALMRMNDERFRFLGIYFWTVVIFFGFSAAKAHIEANWPMTAFVTGLVMVAGDWEHYGRAWQKSALLVLLIADLGAVAGLSYLLLPKESPLAIQNLSLGTSWIRGFPESEHLAGAIKQGFGDFQSRTEEFLGPEAVAKTIEKKFLDSGTSFIVLSSYQLTGVMSFYAPNLEPLLWLPEHGRVRFPWINDQAWAGKFALIAEWPRRGPDYREFFKELSKSSPVEIPGIRSPLFLSIGQSYDPSKVQNR